MSLDNSFLPPILYMLYGRRRVAPVELDPDTVERTAETLISRRITRQFKSSTSSLRTPSSGVEPNA
eukprot:7411514-Pyramimonas_sp.AAC.2